MDELKHNLLIDLADYTATIDLALEGKDLDFDERLWYLGHLAMCGRVFKSVYLDEHVESLERILKIEDASFTIGARNNERGAIAKEAWELFSNTLQLYVRARKHIAPQSKSSAEAQ